MSVAVFHCLHNAHFRTRHWHSLSSVRLTASQNILSLSFSRFSPCNLIIRLWPHCVLAFLVFLSTFQSPRFFGVLPANLPPSKIPIYPSLLPFIPPHPSPPSAFIFSPSLSSTSPLIPASRLPPAIGPSVQGYSVGRRVYRSVGKVSPGASSRVPPKDWRMAETRGRLRQILSLAETAAEPASLSSNHSFCLRPQPVVLQAVLG